MLLQGSIQAANDTEPLDDLYEEEPYSNSPPEPTIVRRAKSYSSFYDAARSHPSQNGAKSRRKKRRKDPKWEALDVGRPESPYRLNHESLLGSLSDELLDASQQEYMYYELPRQPSPFSLGKC